MAKAATAVVAAAVGIALTLTAAVPGTFVGLVGQDAVAGLWASQAAPSPERAPKGMPRRGRSSHVRRAVSTEVRPAIQHRIRLKSAELLIVPEGPPLLPLTTPTAADPVASGGLDGGSGLAGLLSLQGPASAEIQLFGDAAGDPVGALIAEADRGGLDAQDLSAAMRAIATGGDDRARRTLPLLADRLIGRASDLDAPGVASALWATAVLREESPVLHTLLPSLAERLVRTAGRMGAEDAATTLCALASLRAEFAATSLLVAPLAGLLTDRLLQEEDELEPWVLANLFWALTAIPMEEDRLSTLLRLLMRQTLRRADDLDGQATCLILWSIAMMQRRAVEEGTAAEYETSELLPALLSRVRRTADSMTPNELSSVVWAMGALAAGVSDAGSVLTEIRVELACALDGAGLPEMSLALWGLARLDHRDEELLDVAAARAFELESTTPIRVLAVCLPRIFWACAALDFQHTLLMRTVADRFSAVGGSLRHLRPEAFHGLLWAHPRMDTEGKYDTFRDALEAKMFYWLRTRLDYVAISPKTPELRKYFVMLEACKQLGRFGPDAIQSRRK